MAEAKKDALVGEVYGILMTYAETPYSKTFAKDIATTIAGGDEINEFDYNLLDNLVRALCYTNDNYTSSALKGSGESGILSEVEPDILNLLIGALEGVLDNDGEATICSFIRELVSASPRLQNLVQTEFAHPI
jgi:hypothetical protein